MDSGACSQTAAGDARGAVNLFDDCAWLYALCREYLFQDHTKEIIRALFPGGSPPEHATLLEVGCGPGYYARRLARRFSGAAVFGVDRSERMICAARRRAEAGRLQNCHFIAGDVENLSSLLKPVDAVVSSRLLLVVPDRSAALAEIYKVLKPGGRLFLAEPTADFRSRLPLTAMRLTRNVLTLSNRPCLPDEASVLCREDFERLVRSAPWSRCRIGMLGSYQYAVCEKTEDVSAVQGTQTAALDRVA